MSLQNAKEIFLAATELESSDDRETFLTEACGGADILRRRVDALIFAYESPESVLEHVAPKINQGPSLTQTVEVQSALDSNPAPSPRSTSQPRNAPAMNGLIFGLFSAPSAMLLPVPLIGLVPILAIVFSIVGLRKVHAREGVGMIPASIGLILGIFGLILFLTMPMYVSGPDTHPGTRP